MIKKYFNSNVAEASEMIHVTNSKVLEWSNGKVSFMSPYEDGDPVEGSLVDTKIFGTYDDDNLNMGHIELVQPIVNVNFLCGTRPLLPRLLQMDIQDLKKIVSGAHYVVINDCEDLKSGTILSATNYTVEVSKREGLKACTGAEAIQYLLNKAKVSPRTIEFIILKNIPVVPIHARYYKVEGCEENAIRANSLNWLYERVINRNSRLARLLELEAPEIIIVNERRMMQEAVDDLINNGSSSIPMSLGNGVPCISLNELYKSIVTDFKGYKKSNDELNETIPYLGVENSEIKGIITSFIERTKDDEFGSFDTYEEFCENAGITVDEYEEILEGTKQTLADYVTPIIEKVIELCFEEYAEDYRHVLLGVGNSIAKYMFSKLLNAHNEFNSDEQADYIKWMLPGIISQLDVFVTKRIMFVD